MRVRDQWPMILALFASVACMYFISGYMVQASEDSAINACHESETCFRDLILASISNHGLEKGYALLGTIYRETPAFRSDCNIFGFQLASDIYAAYPDYRDLKFAPDVVWCNYSLLQQYPQSMLLAQHNPEQAKMFCSYVSHALGSSVPGAEAECYRGIGRGLPFIDPQNASDQPRMAAAAVLQCKALAENATDYLTCV